MDSLDHAFNSGRRLTQEDIARFVIALGQASDQTNLLRLLRAIQTQDYDVDDYETFVHALMHNDFADMAAGCLTMGAIRTWCDDNSFEVINQCPAVFERWAAPNSYFVSALGQACEDLDNDDKIALLKGHGCNPHEQKLHAFLQREPTLWQYMSPAWLGHANSEQRAAACALGWEMEMLPDMSHQHARRNTLARWVTAFDYAYSMSVATLLWGGQESSAVNRKRLIGMYVDANANPFSRQVAPMVLPC